MPVSSNNSLRAVSCSVSPSSFRVHQNHVIQGQRTLCPFGRSYLFVCFINKNSGLSCIFRKTRTPQDLTHFIPFFTVTAILLSLFGGCLSFLSRCFFCTSI